MLTIKHWFGLILVVLCLTSCGSTKNCTSKLQCLQNRCDMLATQLKNAKKQHKVWKKSGTEGQASTEYKELIKSLEAQQKQDGCY